MLGEESNFQKRWFSTYLKAQCPLPISFVISDGVADVNQIPVISTINGSCKNLSLGPAAICASLDHLDGNGGPTVYLKKVKMSFFNMPNKTATEVISVVNSWNKLFFF